MLTQHGNSWHPTYNNSPTSSHHKSTTSCTTTVNLMDKGYHYLKGYYRQQYNTVTDWTDTTCSCFEARPMTTPHPLITQCTTLTTIVPSLLFTKEFNSSCLSLDKHEMRAAVTVYIGKGVSSPCRGREGMQLQACAVDHQKLYE